MRNQTLSLIIFLLLTITGMAKQADSSYLLKPDRVFDGENMHTNWVVLVKGNKIISAGEASSVKTDGIFTTIELKGQNGMIR